jgi:hypothetical protein
MVASPRNQRNHRVAVIASNELGFVWVLYSLDVTQNRRGYAPGGFSFVPFNRSRVNIHRARDRTDLL